MLDAHGLEQALQRADPRIQYIATSGPGDGAKRTVIEYGLGTTNSDFFVQAFQPQGRTLPLALGGRNGPVLEHALRELCAFAHDRGYTKLELTPGTHITSYWVISNQLNSFRPKGKEHWVLPTRDFEPRVSALGTVPGASPLDPREVESACNMKFTEGKAKANGYWGIITEGPAADHEQVVVRVRQREGYFKGQRRGLFRNTSLAEAMITYDKQAHTISATIDAKHYTHVQPMIDAVQTIAYSFALQQIPLPEITVEPKSSQAWAGMRKAEQDHLLEPSPKKDRWRRSKELQIAQFT